MTKGVLTALITPFNEDYSLDEEGLVQNIHHQIVSRVDGIVVLGTTGESPTLTSDEQKRIIQLAVREAKNKVAVWVGTGSASTAETVRKTQQAKELGADGALVVTPYYNRPTQEGLARHFETLADACHFPILVYNIPGRTAQNMELETLLRLMELPEIIGVKEATGIISSIMRVIESARPGFIVLSGDDNLTLPTIALGGHGVISVVSNLLPTLINELTQAALEGHFSRARELHYRLSPLFRAAFIETNPGPIKALMNYAGLKAGPLRLPLVPLSDENRTRIIPCYEEILTLQN